MSCIYCTHTHIYIYIQIIVQPHFRCHPGSTGGLTTIGPLALAPSGHTLEALGRRVLEKRDGSLEELGSGP